MKLAIIDYDMGNIFSIHHAFLHLGYQTLITQSTKEIAKADALIIPGVGAFGQAMTQLQTLSLIEPIKKFIQSGKPLLGICLGLQILFSKSYEFGIHHGLGILEGDVVKFSQTDIGGNATIPHIGWNQITETKSTATASLHELNHQRFYFLHSYYAKPSEQKIITSTTQYGDLQYCASIQKDNIFATQFHPEKSGAMGLRLIKNWVESWNDRP